MYKAKEKKKFADNHVPNILRRFVGRVKFSFTASQMNMIISNKLVYTSCFTSC